MLMGASVINYTDCRMAANPFQWHSWVSRHVQLLSLLSDSTRLNSKRNETRRDERKRACQADEPIANKRNSKRIRLLALRSPLWGCPRQPQSVEPLKACWVQAIVVAKLVASLQYRHRLVWCINQLAHQLALFHFGVCWFRILIRILILIRIHLDSNSQIQAQFHFYGHLLSLPTSQTRCFPPR